MALRDELLEIDDTSVIKAAVDAVSRYTEGLGGNELRGSATREEALAAQEKALKRYRMLEIAPGILAAFMAQELYGVNAKSYLEHKGASLNREAKDRIDDITLGAMLLANTLRILADDTAIDPTALPDTSKLG